MKITWHGHACFEISSNGYSVVIDPYDNRYATGYPPLKLCADKLLISHEHPGHNCRDAVKISSKGETGNPFKIETMSVCHDSVKGIMRGSCLVHIISAEGIRAAHMGDIGGFLSPEQLDKLKEIDVLMIGAGSYRALPCQEVRRLVDKVQPKLILPMHYHKGKIGNRRLETPEDLMYQFDDDMEIIRSDSDTIEAGQNEKQRIVFLKFKDL